MSFKRKPLVLQWPEGHELHGLVVVCRRPSIEQVDRAETIFEGGESHKAAAVAEAIRTTVGACLISWNYTDESDSEVPATPDGMASLDLAAQMEILGKWIEGSVAVQKDLGKGSSSGPPSRAATSGIPVTGRPGLSDALENLHALNVTSGSSVSSPATP